MVRSCSLLWVTIPCRTARSHTFPPRTSNVKFGVSTSWGVRLSAWNPSQLDKCCRLGNDIDQRHVEQLPVVNVSNGSDFGPLSRSAVIALASISARHSRLLAHQTASSSCVYGTLALQPHRA